MKKNYDIIYSLGRDCACSIYMKMHQLRICSGPFDWLTNAGFEERIDLILNDFSDFFHPQDFRFLPKDPSVMNDANYDYYENTRTNFYFYHDFPVGAPFEETLLTVKEKYLRRIARFYHDIQEKDKVLFIWFSHYHETSDDTLKSAHTAICDKMGKNIDFLIIEHKEGVMRAKRTEVTPNIIKYHLHTVVLDDNNLPTTLGDEELCKMVFSQYGVNVPLKVRIGIVLGNLLSKIVCSLVPVKKWRKALRKKLKTEF